MTKPSETERRERVARQRADEIRAAALAAGGELMRVDDDGALEPFTLDGRATSVINLLARRVDHGRT